MVNHRFTCQPGLVLSSLRVVFHWNSFEVECYYPHYTDGLRVSAFILFAPAHSQKLAELGFEPRQSASEPGEALILWL